MMIRTRSACAFGLLAFAALAPSARADVIVNVNAAQYGYVESPTVPNIGQSVTPITEAPGGGLNQLILTAGVYKITNAWGEFGADYSAFKFNQSGVGQNWTWNFLITNASAGNKAVLYGNGSGLAASAAEAAANAQAYEGYFTLTANAVLNFMIRDNAVGDNSGGVSLRITQIAPFTPVAVPEPTALAMLAAGTILPAAALARRRRNRARVA